MTPATLLDGRSLVRTADPAGAGASIITPAAGSAAPQCGAAYPQNATPRSLARPRRTGVRRPR